MNSRAVLVAIVTVGALSGCATYGPYQDFIPAPEKGPDCYIRLFTPQYEEGDEEPIPVSYGPYCNTNVEQSAPPAVPGKTDDNSPN